MSHSRSGRVILVGAGPGDPELLTLRGAAALREADVVVYDALAPSELLDLAPPAAQRINVGKRGHDEPTRTQPETTALLISLAREGKTVVRLKGGDPYVFGRGAEEASACVEAGVAIEVVPGVSSAIAALAYAGIPVTDRRHSASFAVVTGHKDPTKVSEETRWQALGTAADTLVILMGMRNLETLVAQLVAGGRAETTPSAAIMHGTTPSQRVVEAPLGELAVRAREAGIGAPAAVVIGNVVALRETLAWYERRPLFGRRVLVTRAREQCGEMVAALRRAGAQAVVEPMIEFAPPASFAAIGAALDRFETYDALLFTSANAVRFFAERAVARGKRLDAFPGLVLCVGPKTEEVAIAAGLRVDRRPRRRFDAEGMLAEIENHLQIRGRHFLLPRAEEAREVLPQGLRDRGAVVDAVPVYRTARPHTDAAALRGRLVQGEFDALTFTSPSTVQHFVAMLDDPARAAARRCAIAAIGPVTADALHAEGLSPDVIPHSATSETLIEALAEHFAGASADRTRTTPPGGSR